MPIARVQMPDGRIARFEVPEGTTPEQVQAFAYQSLPKAPAATQKATDPTEGNSFFQNAAAGLGKSMVDTARGLGQMVGLVSQEDIDEAARLDKPLMATGGGITGNVGGQVLQMAAPGGVLTKVAPAAKAMMAARPLAGAAATAGTFAATQPVLTGDTRAGNTAFGAAFGLGGQALASGAGALAKGASQTLSPQVMALYQKAQAAGIPVNMAQLSDSRFLKTLASAVEKMPLTGGVKTRNAQQLAFNRAVAKEFGEQADNITPEVYGRAKARIGGEFNRLSAQNSVKVDNNLMNSLGGIETEAAKFATDDTARAVKAAIDELLGKADAAGNVPGRAYQALDSKLGKLMKPGGEKALFLGQVRESVRTAMDQSISAADKAAWGQARGQYKNLKSIRDLVAKDPSGNISPALLAGRLGANEAGKESLAMGTRGGMGDIAAIGRQFVRDPVPDSGTAQRLMALGAMGGGGYAFGVDPTGILGLMAAGATGGRGINRLLNSPMGGNYMVNGANPLLRGLLAPAQASPLLLPAVANALQQ